jgi:DNA repair exonuclease SbcCD ATPase subunit
MTASAKPSSKHHRIRSLEVTGGFLQGIKMDFSDGLNCVIGGRGTGKTTVLEALRFALDRMPNETVDRKRYEALEKLLQANLGTGSEHEAGNVTRAELINRRRKQLVIRCARPGSR